MTPKVIVITGPTATGKTHLGVALAEKTGGEVVGADSMQVYKHMDIGTAKPEPDETRGVPHHMIDIVSPFESYSVSRYVEDASKCVDDIIARGKVPILVGGTGLYIDALLAGRDFAAEGLSSGVRAELGEEYDRLGGAEMLRRLGEFDPEAAGRLHQNDKKRIVRAFEVYKTTGKTISRHDMETRSVPPRYEGLKIALTFQNREDLYRRIDRRVDIMLAKGLISEVEALLQMGLNEGHTAMQAIGYKEPARFIRGECTLEEAAEDIKRESRRYAKRQLSWLRRDKAVHWIAWEKEPDFEEGVRDSTVFLEAGM